MQLKHKVILKLGNDVVCIVLGSLPHSFLFEFHRFKVLLTSPLIESREGKTLKQCNDQGEDFSSNKIRDREIGC